MQSWTLCVRYSPDDFKESTKMNVASRTEAVAIALRKQLLTV